MSTCLTDLRSYQHAVQLAQAAKSTAATPRGIIRAAQAALHARINRRHQQHAVDDRMDIRRVDDTIWRVRSIPAGWCEQIPAAQAALRDALAFAALPSAVRHAEHDRRRRIAGRPAWQPRPQRFARITTDHPFGPLELPISIVRRAVYDGRLAARLRFQQRRWELAMHIAERYHATVRALYRSSRGEIVYGPVQEHKRWDIYSKRTTYPCVWCDAGVTIDAAGCITLHPVGHADIELPAVPAALVRAWAPAGRHPVGLMAAHTAEPDVYAAWTPIDGHWQPVGLCWRGRLIPQHVAARQYTAADVLAERNSEVQAVMSARYPGGWERLVADAGLQPVQADDYGTLYDVPGREQRLVRVVNSTPDRDGTSRVHWLAVPPTVQTALEAVAWTFRLPPQEYVLQQQS